MRQKPHTHTATDTIAATKNTERFKKNNVRSRENDKTANKIIVGETDHTFARFINILSFPFRV
jgi:hypothetical protein